MRERHEVIGETFFRKIVTSPDSTRTPDRWRDIFATQLEGVCYGAVAERSFESLLTQYPGFAAGRIMRFPAERSGW